MRKLRFVGDLESMIAIFRIAICVQGQGSRRRLVCRKSFEMMMSESPPPAVLLAQAREFYDMIGGSDDARLYPDPVSMASVIEALGGTTDVAAIEESYAQRHIDVEVTLTFEGFCEPLRELGVELPRVAGDMGGKVSEKGVQGEIASQVEELQKDLELVV